MAADSLDTVICDPLLAAAFDSFAARLAPGFSSFEYRWAALGLRKAGRYMKEAMATDVPAFEDLGSTSDLSLNQVAEQGSRQAEGLVAAVREAFVEARGSYARLASPA